MFKKTVTLLFCLIMCGCAAREQTAEFFAMDTYMQIRYHSDKDLSDKLEDRVRQIEREISVTDTGSAVYKLNESGRAVFSHEGSALVDDAIGLCAKTEGAMDISVYPIVREWGFTTGEYHIPDDDVIARLLERTDYRLIKNDGDIVTVPDGMMIDLGCIGKGYTGDVLAEMLREEGVRSGILDLGGNIQTIGKKPDGSMWRVGIRSPLVTSGYDSLGVLMSSDEAVITSGGYERFFEENGKVYWHIIDPSTGYPAKSGIISATVIGGSGEVCDALSTALFVMGEERAADFWRDDRSFDMILVTDDGRVVITPSVKDRFTLNDGEYLLQVIDDEN
ncbi:MAG: FAD:protein FMN transferase [Oscillospiraceae bacterium]|nr:FAD:protein FMN transferase [Oscillospiraceae bacterium]